jgi:type IV pilus biogenesis protein CpaD/CtpE
MKRLLALIVTGLLAGCAATDGVTRHFPDVPEDLKKPCPELELVSPKTDKLSDVVTVVSDNYTEYHLCRIRVDGWIEWYNAQKSIFESVK